MGSVRGWGSVKKRRDGWQVDCHVAGHRIRKSYPTAELANAALRTLRQDRATGRDPSIGLRGEGVTYAEIIPEVVEALRVRGIRERTLRLYTSEFAELERDWGDRRIISTRPRDVTRWVVKLQAKGLSSSSIRHRCDRLSQIHRHVEANELTPVPPCRVPRPPLRTRPRQATAEELIEQLVTAARAYVDRRALAVLLLAADAGLRAAEISALRWRHVDLERGTITVAEGKGGKRRLVPILTSRLRAALTPAGTGALLERTDPYSAGRALAPVWGSVRPGEMPQLHALRHRFATRVLGAPDVAPDDVRQWLGHGDLRTTAVYTHERAPTAPEGVRVALEGPARRAPGSHRASVRPAPRRR